MKSSSKLNCAFAPGLSILPNKRSVILLPHTTSSSALLRPKIPKRPRVQALLSSSSSSSSSTATKRKNDNKTCQKKPTAAPKLKADGDSLETTPSQIALVTTHFTLCAAVTGHALMSSLSTHHDMLSVLEPHACMLMIAYFFTDLAVGIYHHAVDNYGSENTPIFGYQIAAFQGHHVYPWTITSRGFANNLYRLTKPTIPQLLLLLLLPLSPLYTTFHASILFFIVLSQETHRQAHMMRPAQWARKLQQWNIIVPQRTHAAHHKGAFDDNYCILSGHWNRVLDNLRFFRVLEAFIYKISGNEPECWRLNPELRTESMNILQKIGLESEV